MKEYIEFRCMIQDIIGNEIYSLEGDSDKLADRTVFYCITIPGQNDWVHGLLPNQESWSIEPTGSSGNCILLVNQSFPIPHGKNKSCLIKVYDIDQVDCLRVNDVVQVGGYKESPEEGSPEGGSPKEGSPKEGSPQVETTDNDFEPAKDFPKRLVPRVHVQTLKKLPHINPLLPPVIDRTSIDLTKLKMARARLSTIISQLLGGDTLMTEYLILSLISKIHKRNDIATLGQLTMCLSGFKPEMRFLVEKLYEIISKITTHSHFIDLSIANLNNLRFTPEKDHENNKLIAGTLQLPDGLFLMLNETALSEGLLTAQGTSNLDALNQIIRWQKHKYNFQFHSVEIDTDLKILVIAEGKSILPVHMTVNIEKNDAETIDSMRQACEAVNDFLTDELLNMFRYYITYLMDVTVYEIPEDVTASITADFVAWRKDDEENNRPVFSADDLSSRMTLARYMTISQGGNTLTRDIWEQICRMETARLARLTQ